MGAGECRMMTTDTIRKLSALCKRWEELDKERADIEAQIEKLLAPEACDGTKLARSDRQPAWLWSGLFAATTN